MVKKQHWAELAPEQLCKVNMLEISQNQKYFLSTLNTKFNVDVFFMGNEVLGDSYIRLYI